MAYWKSSKLREKVSYFLIMVLSIVDLGVGTIGTSLNTVFLASEIIGTGNCGLFFAQWKITITLVGLSIAPLSVINIERYMGIIHPIVHRSKVTKKKLLKFVIFIWIFCTIRSCLSFFEKQIAMYVYTIYLLHFPVLTVYVYARIFFAIRMRRRHLTSPSKSTPSSNDKNWVGNFSKLESKRRFLQEMKLLKSCFLVVICFSVCIVPICVLPSLNVSGFYLSVYRTWGETLTMINSSLNSVILFWRNRILRKEAKCILKKVFYKS